MPYAGTMPDFSGLMQAYRDKAQMQANRPSFVKGLATGIPSEITRQQNLKVKDLNRQKDLYGKISTMIAEKGRLAKINPTAVSENDKYLSLNINEMVQTINSIANAYQTGGKVQLPEGIVIDNVSKKETTLVDIPVYRIDRKGNITGIAYTFKGKRGMKPPVLKEGQDIADVIAQVKSMYGDEIPPGLIVNVGGISVPFNPKLTQDQSIAVVSAEQVEEDVTELLNIMEQESNSFNAINLLWSKLPYIATFGTNEEIKRLSDQLKARIPFAKGGKQMTPTELEVLEVLLPQPGQSTKTLKSNLNKFVTEFNRLSEIAKGGREAAIKGSTPQAGTIGQEQGNQKDQFNNQFNSEEEAKAANLPIGTVIYIQGRKAVIE